MTSSVQIPRHTRIERCEEEIGNPTSEMCVWMYDPWCRTPWYTASLTRALLNCNLQVRLISPRYHLEPQYFQQEGLITRPGPFDLSSRGRPKAQRIRQAGRIAEYLANTACLSVQARLGRPDILHQQQCVLLERGIELEMRFLRWCQQNGTRIVYTVHNLLPHLEKSTHADSFQRLYRQVDTLICHSVQTAHEIESQFSIDPRRIHVVPHGPLFCNGTTRSQSECRKYLGLDTDRQVMLSHGVIRTYKGTDILLRAWKKLMDRWRGGSPPFLLIAGLGSESDMRALRRIADDLGLSRKDVRMDLRYVPAHDVPYYFCAADVLLYPYREITTSGALLTGLNYCKPVIASDLPPFREYLRPDVNAILLPPEDANSLTDALFEVSGNEQTYQKLLKGSQNNLDLQMQWSEIGSRTEAVYRSVLA